MHDPRSILVTLLGLGVFVLGVVRGSELLATGGLGTAVVGLLLPGLAEAAVGNFFSVKKKEAAAAPDFGDLLTPDLEQSLGTAARRMLGDAGRARHSVETAVMRARSAWGGQPAEAVRPFLLCNLFHVMLAMPAADVDPAAETDLPDDPLLGRSVEHALMALGREERALWLLHYEDLEQPVIARILDRPPDTIGEAIEAVRRRLDDLLAAATP